MCETMHKESRWSKVINHMKKLERERRKRTNNNKVKAFLYQIVPKILQKLLPKEKTI